MPDSERIGYEAAKLLDTLMTDKTVAGAPANTQSALPHEQFVPPAGIVTRRSTDVTAIEDANVAEAMHYIRLHACDGISVEDVMQVTDVSRSVLQRRFKSLMGRSIHDVIVNIRITRVKELLSETQLPLPIIAKRTGFKHSEYLSTVFKEKTGDTITTFRRYHSQTVPD